MSRETADDILAFLLAITKVCYHFHINFIVRFCMIDAAPEEAKAILEMNSKELKPVYDDILHACDSLHYCTSQQAFEDKKFEILSSWSALVWKKDVYIALQKFKRYFIEQWLEGSFSNWQIFNTPPGYATTQNPEESFNKQIKDHFTEWQRLTMLGAVECIFKIVVDYSTNHGDFAIVKDK